jgi:hypothetical protein
LKNWLAVMDCNTVGNVMRPAIGRGMGGRAGRIQRPCPVQTEDFEACQLWMLHVTWSHIHGQAFTRCSLV